MAQDFPRSANTIARVVLIGLALALAGGLAAWVIYVWSPLGSRVGQAPPQPIWFSHRVHTNQVSLDCRYCHTSVEESAFAGIPPTETCQGCHATILAESPLLRPVQQSLRTGEAIAWNRVHDLPDHTYFNHSVHVRQGFGCDTCHGRVDQAPLLTQVNQEMTMGWCLECHRQPERFVRPREEVFNLDWQPPANQLALGRQLVAEYGIVSRTSCSICHR